MAYFTPYTIVDFFSSSQQCGSLVFFFFLGKRPAVYRTNKPASVESTLLKGGKAKKIKKKQRKITKSQKKHHFWSKRPAKTCII
jgi:hypothetical protein